ncbi:unnamed protein product [Phytophthora fragariaefolia]|uniref:Unnamed protein product n=1 Tax=Phytophthora fragariaefolia TaxID=1490495 RepID=A0A9W6U6M7_9STRA|nr:unnamed protein product [Phytophthora fragariaefolia]
MSLPAKLEKLCPCFHPMEKVFGERPNINPPATVELEAVLHPNNADGHDQDDVASDENVRAIAQSFDQDDADNASPAPEPSLTTRPAICSPETPSSSYPSTLDDELLPNPEVSSCEYALLTPQLKPQI